MHHTFNRTHRGYPEWVVANGRGKVKDSLTGVGYWGICR